MPGLSAMCECGVEFWTNETADYGLCPACQRAADRLYANDPTPVLDVEYEPSPWSRRGMQERLGVIGDVDE